MPQIILPPQDLSSNRGFTLIPNHSQLCPHPECGAQNLIVIDQWNFTSKHDQPYGCWKCQQDMHVKDDGAVTMDDLTARQLDVLRAIKDHQPIRHDELAHKAGVSERTVTNAVRILKELGVKLTGAGYTYEELP